MIITSISPDRNPCSRKIISQENSLQYFSSSKSPILSIIFLLAFTATSFGGAGKSYPVNFISLAPTMAVNVSCNNNGTLANGSDDYITFQLDALPPSADFEAPYTYTMTASQGGSSVVVTLSDGTAATNVPFGIISPFRTSNGTAGQGDVILTVTPNFGSYTPVNYTITDPGVCTLPDFCEPGIKTESYSYRSPASTTEAVDWVTHIPKFNPVAGQTLSGVSVTMTGHILNSYCFENRSANAVNPTVNISAVVDFELGGTSLTLANNTVDILNQSFSLPPQIILPAAGAWTGDVANSTIEGMGPISGGFLRNRAFAYLDPRADSKWITNITGNPGDDDDIFIVPSNHKMVTNPASYSAAPDLAHFIGLSGNVPLTYSTALNYSGAAGSGGNPHETIRTQTYFEIDLTYTYNETCTAMPVKLKGFSGKQAEGNVSLNWEVAEEYQVSHYEVQHSVNAKTFRTVSIVPANGSDRYSSLDRTASSGKNYYRLKSVDLDGTFAYSHTIGVDFVGENFLKVFPNPVSGRLSIETENIGDLNKVEILDNRGVIVKSLRANEMQGGMSLESLSNGTYIVKVIFNNGGMRSRTIVVAR
jgi:hypothetical protein